MSGIASRRVASSETREAATDLRDSAPQTRARARPSRPRTPGERPSTHLRVSRLRAVQHQQRPRVGHPRRRPASVTSRTRSGAHANPSSIRSWFRRRPGSRFSARNVDLSKTRKRSRTRAKKRRGRLRKRKTDLICSNVREICSLSLSASEYPYCLYCFEKCGRKREWDLPVVESEEKSCFFAGFSVRARSRVNSRERAWTSGPSPRRARHS